jgi:PAS domain-containing protein
VVPDVQDFILLKNIYINPWRFIYDINIFAYPIVTSHFLWDGGMASKSGRKKKSGSARSRDAGDKGLIAELNNRIAALENELRLKQDQTVLDATEHERAIEQLAEKERFLSNIFECIQDGVSVLDKDLNIIQVNPAMEKWYGENITGKKCYQAYHGRSEPCEPCPSIRAIRTGARQIEIVHDIKGHRARPGHRRAQASRGNFTEERGKVSPCRGDRQRGHLDRRPGHKDHVRQR